MQCFTSHRVSGLASRSTCGHAQKNSSRTSTGLVGCRLGKDFHRAIKSRAGNDVDNIDLRQEVDIERLINLVHDLEDKMKRIEGDLVQSEQRDRDRMVALRSVIRESLASVGVAATSTAVGTVVDKLEAADQESVMMGDAKWDSYSNSFTVLMSKGYLQTVDKLRDRLMSTEWELGKLPIALELGVSKFESYCAQNNVDISYETISALYDDPMNLAVIEDPHVRMQARSCISSTKATERLKVFDASTAEAQKLSQQFSEGEFISKLLPDPIEQGVTDAFRKIVMPVSRILRGGK